MRKKNRLLEGGLNTRLYLAMPIRDNGVGDYIVAKEEECG